ncbi:MAG: hypothetical protein M0042_15010 [Nitrospiraceae bacterium]|nr:hypothetical protein [Nitrospiraceae bacterium]
MNLSISILHQAVCMFGILFTLAALQPEAALSAARPFLSLWLAFKRYRQSLAVRFKSNRSERFWEIDMTKFEP